MPQEPHRTIELYVRSLSDQDTSPRLPAILERLESLSETGEIDDFEVHVWGERISTDDAISETEAGTRIHTRITEFREWASDHGYSLSGGFDVRSTHSTITGETTEFMTLPTLTLCEREDGEIATVVPHESAGDVVTASDFLASLKAPAATAQTGGLAATATDD